MPAIGAIMYTSSNVTSGTYEAHKTCTHSDGAKPSGGYGGRGSEYERLGTEADSVAAAEGGNANPAADAGAKSATLVSSGDAAEEVGASCVEIVDDGSVAMEMLECVAECVAATWAWAWA